MTKNRTLKSIYDALDPIPPKTAWIKRVAKAAKVSEFTVRMWLNGRQVPQAGIQELVARELGVPAEELFPERKETSVQPLTDVRHGLL